MSDKRTPRQLLIDQAASDLQRYPRMFAHEALERCWLAGILAGPKTRLYKAAKAYEDSKNFDGLLRAVERRAGR